MASTKKKKAKKATKKEAGLVSVGELQEKGLLMEANREFFHQFGLNLFADGDELKVADLREGDEAPIIYYDKESARKSIEIIKVLHEERRKQGRRRTGKFGFSLQPVKPLTNQVLDALKAQTTS